MTINSIQRHLRDAAKKSVKRRQVYNYFTVLGIEPIGARQRPQQYPEDSAHRILAHLGFKNGAAKIISIKEAKRQAGKRGAK